jgi:hypothetical protein
VTSEARLELKKGISIYPRASAYYNHILIKTGLINRYPKIREKDKIKFYYCSENDNEFDVFAYVPGSFPAEVVMPMDLDSQFFTLIVEPVNRLLTAMKMSSLDPNLKRAVAVVKAKGKKAEDEANLYPLYVVNQDSLEHEEVPEKFWKILGNPEADVEEADFPEYLTVLTKYGLNTIVVPKMELEKYIKRLTKKKEKGMEVEDLVEEENV